LTTDCTDSTDEIQKFNRKGRKDREGEKIRGDFCCEENKILAVSSTEERRRNNEEESVRIRILNSSCPYSWFFAFLAALREKSESRKDAKIAKNDFPIETQ